MLASVPAFPATRWSLIARLPDQPQQVNLLVGMYAEAIGAYLHTRLREERIEHVDDIIQEVLLDLLGKPDVLAKAQPGQGSRFRYYVMHLAWLGACNALRKYRRDDPCTPVVEHADSERWILVDQLSTVVKPPDMATMDRAWALSVIQDALDSLSAAGAIESDVMQILGRNLVQGHGIREIARDLHIPVVTCHRRCAKARAVLQDAIVERLQLAGELGATDDPTAACEVLLRAIAQG